MEFLSDHANLRLQTKDIVAISGLKLHAWREQRVLQTSFLSVIEKNPKERDGLTLPEPLNDDEPKRKAIRLSDIDILSISEVKAMMQKIDSATVDATLQCVKSFIVRAQIGKFGDDFFEEDPPIKDSRERDIMCFSTSLEDNTGRVNVKLWDRACSDILGITASKLREYWEQGVEDPTTQKELLTTLNKNFSNVFTCSCSLSFWKKGIKDVKGQVTINVNAAEMQEANC